MNDETILVERARSLGCPVPMVDDRTIPRSARFSASMTQAHAFADTLNREAGFALASVEKKDRHQQCGSVWVRVGRRAFEIPELRAMLLLEGHVSRLAKRLVAERGGERT